MAYDNTSGILQTYAVPKRRSKNKPPRPRKVDPWDKAGILKLELDTYRKYEQGQRSFPKHLIEAVVRETKHGPWLLLTGQPDHLCPAYRSEPDLERPIEATNRQSKAAI